MSAVARLVSVVIPVYRDGARAASVASAVLEQVLPTGWSVEVIVVDDGSDDETPAQLAACNAPRIRTLQLPRNLGRSGARNAGVEMTRGEIVLFMDCDCVPATDGLVIAHIHALSTGAVASTGNVCGEGSGFWNRYQIAASARRKRQHQAGVVYSGSSQNLAVRRSSFVAAGGFDTGYRRYGFEDRDLLLRLAELGPVAWADKAEVRHLDTLSLTQIAAKMMEAGEFSSARFEARHPIAYRALGYAQIDVSKRRAARWLASASASALLPLTRVADSALMQGWVPYALKASLTRCLSGVGYLIGTSRRRTANQSNQ